MAIADMVGLNNPRAKWLYGLAGTGFIISTVLLNRRAQGASDVMAHGIGTYLGYTVGFCFLLGVASLFWKALRPFVLPSSLVVAALMVSLPSLGVAMRSSASGPAYYSNAQLSDWFARARTQCLSTTIDAKACNAVSKVLAITDKQADFVVFAYDAASNVKITMTTRQFFTAQGLCWTVPRAADLAVGIYQSNTPIGEISDSDVQVTLTQSMREELLPQLLGQSGQKEGDVLCDKYVIHDTKDGKVQALRAVSFVNGQELKGGDEIIMRFYDGETRLPLGAPLN